MKPNVTVLVTAKNSESTINKCIESILNQTYKNFILYVTDGYSSDKTWEIIKKYKKKYPKKIIAERIKGNAPHAFNKMIKKVKTLFIAFTDSDCVVKKDWLTELLKPYKSTTRQKNIIATAGFCGTPRNVNLIQKVIGRELESRFKKSKKIKYLLHAPTMNFSIITEVAKKCKMNEHLDVAFETEWGMRLNKKYGKILYTPKAKVFHYHRSSIIKYLYQQFRQATYVTSVYFIHRNHLYESLVAKQRDPISNRFMSLQIDIFGLLIVFGLLSFLNKYIQIVFELFLLLLIAIVFYQALKFSKKIKEFLIATFIFFLRIPTWFIGIIYGFHKYIIKRK